AVADETLFVFLDEKDRVGVLDHPVEASPAHPVAGKAGVLHFQKRGNIGHPGLPGEDLLWFEDGRLCRGGFNFLQQRSPLEDAIHSVIVLKMASTSPAKMEGTWPR